MGLFGVDGQRAILNGEGEPVELFILEGQLATHSCPRTRLHHNRIIARVHFQPLELIGPIALIADVDLLNLRVNGGRQTCLLTHDRG